MLRSGKGKPPPTISRRKQARIASFLNNRCKINDLKSIIFGCFILNFLFTINDLQLVTCNDDDDFCGHHFSAAASEREEYPSLLIETINQNNNGMITSEQRSSKQRIGQTTTSNPQQRPPEQSFIDDGSKQFVIGNTNGNGKNFISDCQQQQSGSNQEKLLVDCDNNNNVKTIETAVFVDSALDGKFTGLSGGLVELNKLIMTIMNQVQQLFKYSSLKTPVNVKLVLVEHMSTFAKESRNGPPLPSAANGDIDLYLSNFCNWQQARLENEKRLWWDHAILLSGLVGDSYRLDLYKSSPNGKNHSGVLGLAWVGGMCKGNFSCTINEASNLESAFVIAHEIGHSLGIMHDGQRNNCDPNGFLMSERTGAGKVHWSRCSNQYLNDSIGRRQLACLETEKSLQQETLYDLTKLKLPGQVYTINDQCKLAFGSNYTSYVTEQKPFNTVCRELWCVAGTWAKAAHPALEGSLCGEQGRLCREGKCL